jgi:ComF family protein
MAAPACGTCLREPPPFEHTVCAADYGFPWDRLIADFKFHGRAELASVLAERVTAAVREARAPQPDLVVAVPMSAARLAQRGYNQAWELARHVAATLALPASATMLLRAVDTTHQVELGRAERQRNLRNAFMVNPSQRAAVRGRRVALVDDVMTTGATARAAAEALLRARAAAVDVWVLARTPEH